MCNNVLREWYRDGARHTPPDDDDNEKIEEMPAPGVSALESLESKEVLKKVRETLDELPERDRRVLREVFLEERDKDAVCRDFNVDREYLRVLVLRAKERFRAKYLKNKGDDPPKYGRAQGF
jgi:RNA polymerase sigma-70 factor (ECF subfamily)